MDHSASSFLREYLSETNVQEGLKTSFIGRKICTFGILKSTNDHAWRLAEEGAGEGTVVIAEEQTAGRGRFGRSWASPSGMGIWCSVIFRPSLFPWEAPRMTMMAALAAARAISASTGVPVSLKWPNDVLIEGKKVCGILTELSAETDAVRFVITGIGINVHQREGDFPAALRDKAVSLHMALDGPVSRMQVIRCLLGELENVYVLMNTAGFAALRREIVSLSCVVGRAVSVRQKNLVYRGRVLDIDETGGLVMELAGGRIEHIISGEVQLV
jgi:BirA family biotin operon repressor/biotin-[acetyl-CoA-carboxylase] ligase